MRRVQSISLKDAGITKKSAKKLSILPCYGFNLSGAKSKSSKSLRNTILKFIGEIATKIKKPATFWICAQLKNRLFLFVSTMDAKLHDQWLRPTLSDRTEYAGIEFSSPFASNGCEIFYLRKGKLLKVKISKEYGEIQEMGQKIYESSSIRSGIEK